MVLVTRYIINTFVERYGRWHDPILVSVWNNGKKTPQNYMSHIPYAITMFDFFYFRGLFGE